MKRIVLLICLSMFFLGCNNRPNKESRIQNLETQILETKIVINKLKISVQALEVQNAQLKKKVDELEKK
ncbi:MAG: hypothetical protein ACI8ZN_000666 [Bacteroidia bacterium]|jgi:uncharacterized coiled-coil protein SlyX